MYFTKRSIRLSQKDIIANYDSPLDENNIEETDLQQKGRIMCVHTCTIFYYVLLCARIICDVVYTTCAEIESKFCKPIAIENFPHHVRQMHQDVDRGFEDEFWVSIQLYDNAYMHTSKKNGGFRLSYFSKFSCSLASFPGLTPPSVIRNMNNYIS